MNFFKSFSPLIKKLKLKKYFLEIVLLIISIIITVAALAIYAKNSRENIDQTVISNDQPEKIYVDVSGSVEKPNIYQINFGARIKEVIDKAGGLSDNADVMFFSRNFNLARIVTDQEKIYVPSIVEINNKIFIENQRTLDYASPVSDIINSTSTMDVSINNQLINLNSATIEELDQLPGIGQVTANKIIANRPYLALDELLIKKVVNKSVFEKVKDLITIN